MFVTMALTSLLVCADAQAIQVLTRILQDLGIAVETCGNLPMAQARLDDQHFDAVLLDCHQEAAAMELIVHTRSEAINKTTVVIAIVGSSNNVREIFSKGASFALYKPISRERAAHSMRAARGLMQRERRIGPRIAVEAKASVAYSGKEDVPAALVDLSEEGMALRTGSKLPPACKVYFQFSLPGNSSLVRLSGEVMWQDSAGRAGIRFADVPQVSRRALKNWLQANPVTQRDPAVASAPGASATDDTSERLSAGLGLLSVAAGDRRDLSRRRCCLGVEVYRANISAPTRCTLIDVSSGGCYVESSETFPEGTPLELVVRTENLKLRILGKVQSMHPGFGMGIKFSLRTEEHRQQVQQLIACAESESRLSI